MREWEMRQRIENALKRRMQGILAPTLGLGLAIAGFGCGGTEYGAQYPHGQQPQRLDGGEVIQDGAGSAQDVPIYPTPIDDAAPVDMPAGNEAARADLDTSPVDVVPALD